jgi:SAM-dependent methyltransferase
MTGNEPDPMRRRFGEILAAGGAESPAAERNKQPILAVLERVLPARGTVLEIASGTGQHVVHFARALPRLEWQPTDPDGELRAVIAARVAAAQLPNVRPPLELDVLDGSWPSAAADAVLCSNMIHIAPAAATPALLRGAARVLGAGAPLALYGPYKRDGRHTSASNAAFDDSLRARDPDWGVRDLDEVAAAALGHGFELGEVVEMPANNLMVVLRRAAVG